MRRFPVFHKTAILMPMIGKTESLPKAQYVAYGIAAFTTLVVFFGSLGGFTPVPLVMSLLAPALLAAAIYRPWTVAICGSATLLMDALPWGITLIRQDVEWLGPALLLFPVLMLICLVGACLDYAHGRKNNRHA